MTVPISLTGRDTDLEWEKQHQKRDQTKATADVTLAVNPPVDADKAVQDSQQLVDIATRQGKAATAGVTGMLSNLQQQQTVEEQKAFQRRQTEAMQELQEQQKLYNDNLTQMYQEQLDQSLGHITDQFKDYQKDADKAKNDFLGSIQNASTSSITGQQYTGNAAQIAQYARQAGFPESEIPTAVAVAMAESGGRADAINTSNSNGSVDRGLMQINSIHSDLLKQHDWSDPMQNMQMAYQIWKNAGGSWTPWSAYNNGSYKSYTSLGQAAYQTALNSYTGGSRPANISPYMANTPMGMRAAIVANAQEYLGVPYEWGGTTSKGIDCSGLVQAAYKSVGIDLPRVSANQATYGVRTSISNLLPGDLVAWNDGGKVHHIAIYKGNGQIIEAPYSGTTVRVRSLNNSDKVFGVHINLQNR